MKFGTVLFISATTAQENYDYGLDGAAINPVAYDGNYNYASYGNYADEGERLREKPNTDLSALLANLLGDSSYTYDYGNAYNTDYNDVLAAINAAEATAGTTESPPDYAFNMDNFYESYDGVSSDDAAAANAVAADAVADDSANAGRPDGDEDNGVKLFENFVDDTASNQFVQALLDDGQTYCWSCHGSGSDSAASLAACAANGSSVNCLDQGENDYCMISLRQVNGQITQIESGCAQRDTCDGINNFYDPTGKMDWKKDQCKPINDNNGNAYATNARNRGRESKCSICHYTTKTYGAQNPTEVTDDDTVDNISKMRFNGNDVEIVGNTVSGQPTTSLTAGSFGSSWGTQANNVLDMFN